VDNTYNDFHTRSGAKEAGAFITLAEHAAQVDTKLEALKDRVANRSADEIREIAELTCAHAGAAKRQTTVESQKSSPGEPGKETNPKPPANKTTATPLTSVKQHLVIIGGPRHRDRELQQFDRNLAGEKLLPELDPDDWPTAADIAASQRRYLTRRTRRALQEVDTPDPDTKFWINQDRKIVIPEQDNELIARIVAVAHQGQHGHIAHDITRKRCEQVFTWPNMRDQVKRWVCKCLQCIKLAGGKLMPRPLGHQLLATLPMEVVAIDFLDMGRGKGGYKYLLVIVGQLTRTSVMVATKDETAHTAATIFCTRWLAFFPDPTFLISDGGPHFNAELFRSIATIRPPHHRPVRTMGQRRSGEPKQGDPQKIPSSAKRRRSALGRLACNRTGGE
jgi:hypothetical protein